MADVVRTKKVAPKPERPFPEYNGFGSKEDSMGSVKSLVPKPPRKDFKRMLAYDKIMLKFLAKFEMPMPKHEDREFIIMFHLSDNTIQIAETRVHNSGFPGGAFLARMKCENPATGQYFAEADFGLDAVITVNKFAFRITKVDENSGIRQACTLKTQLSPNEILRRMSETEWYKNKGHQLTAQFREVDQDKNNRISKEEFRDWCTNKGFNVSAEEAQLLLETFDTDGDGQINVVEFMKSIEKFALGC